jgi:hypothetical protein
MTLFAVSIVCLGATVSAAFSQADSDDVTSQATGQDAVAVRPPTLSSITPSYGPIGTHIVMKGTGLNYGPAFLILDGKFSLSLDAEPHLSNDGSALEFDLPRLVEAYPHHRPQVPGKRIGVQWARYPLEAGQHSISLHNPHGDSNSVSFSVSDYLGQATVDSRSLVQSTGNPTLSGAASSSVTSLGLSFNTKGGPSGLSVYRLDNPIPVVNRRWSVQLVKQKSWQYSGIPDPFPLKPGTYPVTIWDWKTKSSFPTVNITITNHQ